jgi:hypothetical protein
MCYLSKGVLIMTNDFMVVNKCFTCGNDIAQPTGKFTTGYGVDKDNNKICYACCANQDLEYMRQHGKNTLYLTKNKDGKHEVTNYPGSLRFPVWHIKESWHNIAGKRYDAWFGFEGYYWHAVQYGDNTQIAHCKKTKTIYIKP